MATTDVMTFARAWMTEPRRTGAVLPSGSALAHLMTSEITPDIGPVLELGPGTGVFTRSLLERGVRQDELTLVESAPNFARLLQLRFPHARVLARDARSLAQEGLYAGRQLGAVISGLPLLSLSADDVTQILSGALLYLRPAASFYQFTYGPTCPVPRAVLKQLDCDATRVGWTIRNFPPASVYRIGRR